MTEDVTKIASIEKIVYEEEERAPTRPNEDCVLLSFLHPPQPLPRHPPKLHSDAATETRVDVEERAIGPALMMVNKATTYEFQSLSSAQAQRALTNTRLINFLREVLPNMERELEECRLFEKIL
ncbi:hypothetical protein PMAYCL1PPCAC_11227 [Pristionchus mayeri]|uniref:Uncharacterized protein n=1 Tax=Pristionchus mayeri TaxID=1317129 RepID=A0AAN4ZGX6_9BILA|nr:hypothetical protein PMAYCL1PPCAC_11227 [Pristionchus mayeri]